MTRFIKSLLAVGLALICTLGVAGCSPYPYNTLEFSDEYFKYHVLEPKKIGGYGKTECYIVGLTEKGLQQKHLIVSDYYGEYKINGIGYMGNTYVMSTHYIGDFESENLEKLYLDCHISGSWEWVRSEVYNLPNCYIVFWHTDSDLPYVSNILGKIYGYNYYVSYIYPDSLNNKSIPIIIANVSYLYNYEDAPNENYYWVDSYDESIITFIPPQPQREGYIFDGWYKEAECINKWDFTTDITGKEIVIEENKVYDTYEGIYLYAKWIEK